MRDVFGPRLKAHRTHQGMSLRQLGAQLGVSFSTLARLERGHGAPSPHTRLRVAQWMDPDGEHPPCHCAQCTFPREDRYRALQARIERLEAQMQTWEQGGRA
jgi:transcriptional regulator with XRE-family HTH domain